MKKIESNMLFEYNDENVYCIEDDIFYTKITSKYGVKVCDFILLKDNNLIFIEAKSSIPKNNNDKEEFTLDIKKKFMDSLILYLGVINDRKNTISRIIHKNMKNSNLFKKKIKLLLIVNNVEKGNLETIRDYLSIKLRDFIYMFSIENILVINHEQAKSKGLIK